MFRHWYWRIRLARYPPFITTTSSTLVSTPDPRIVHQGHLVWVPWPDEHLWNGVPCSKYRFMRENSPDEESSLSESADPVLSNTIPFNFYGAKSQGKMLLGRDLISNLPGEVRNMIYRVVLDSLTLARVRCRTCPLVFADKGILQSCTKWFPTNRIIYQEANTLFCVEYLPNMGVFLPSMQQLSDCIQIFGDRCPRLYACMSGYMAYPSCAYMYLRGECEKQMNQVLRSDTQGIGLYTWGADAAWKWIEPVGVGEDEVSVYTCFVRSDRFASLLIRGNVGRAPWLRELLFNTEFRRKMNMSPLGVRRSARVFMKKQGMKK